MEGLTGTMRDGLGHRYLSFAGLAGLIAVLLTVMDGERSLTYMLGGTKATILFSVSSLSAAVIVGLFVTRRGIFQNGALVGNLHLGGVVSGASLLAQSILAKTDLPPFYGSVVGVCFGAGIAGACISRAIDIASSNRSKRDLLRFLATACVAAAGLKIVALLIPARSTAIFLALLLLLSTFLSTARLDVNQLDSSTDQGAIGIFRSLVSNTWILFGAFIPCLMILAFMWAVSLLNHDSTVTGIYSPYGTSTGFLLGAILFICIAAFVPSDKMDLLYLIVPLLCVASLLVIWFLGMWQGTTGLFFSNIPLGFSIASFVILIPTRLSEALRELPPCFSFGFVTSASAALLLLFFSIWPLLGKGLASALTLTVKVIYLAAVAVYMVVFTAKERTSGASGRQEDPIVEKCTAIAQFCSLSEREKETLYFLAEGMSAPHIAKIQYVSVNTVKTHIKRIYAKTGVHSKEELIDLIHRPSSIDHTPSF